MTAQLYLRNLWAAARGRPLITQDDHDAIVALYLERLMASEEALADARSGFDAAADEYLALTLEARRGRDEAVDERKAAAINCGKNFAAYADRIKRFKLALHKLADEA